MLSLIFCLWISIRNRWQLKPFFVLTSFPPLLYGLCWHLRIWSVPLGTLLVYLRLFDEGIGNFNILEFKFAGAPPWIFLLFVSFYFCRSWSKLSIFLLSDDPCMHSCTSNLFPSILMGPNLVRVVGCAAELCAILLALSLISFHDSLLFILTPEVPCRALGAFIHAIP